MMNARDPEPHVTWEDQLREAIRTGEPVVLGAAQPGPDAHLVQIPAADIRSALLGERTATDPRGLWIHGALITGPLNLENAAINCPITITHSRFTDAVHLNSLNCPQLNLSDTHAPHLALNGSRTTGRVILRGFETEGGVCAVGARIGGQLVVTRAHLKNPCGHSLNLDGAHIETGLIGRGLVAIGEVRAVGATIGGSLTLTDARIDNPAGHALTLERIQINGDLLLDGHFTTRGEVNAKGAAIAGPVSLSGADLTNPNGIALTLDGAQVNSDVHLVAGFVARGEVHALGTTINGQLDLHHARLHAPNGAALTLDGAHITDSVILCGQFCAVGEVRALGANIGGELDLRGALLFNLGGKALSLDGVQLSSKLILADGFTTEGEVCAAGAHIGGQLNLNGAHLSNEGGIALALDQSRIKGGAFLTGGLVASGEVRARGATIDGQLILKGAHLSNQGKDALSLDGVLVSGSAHLDGGFVAEGCVSAVGASFTRQLDLSSACLTNSRGRALDLEQAQISGVLSLDDGFVANGGVSLAYSRLGSLVAQEEPPAQLELAGWHVESLIGPLSQTKVAEKWLNAVPDAHFSVQPWHEVAASYARLGRPADATKLRFKAEKKVTARSPWRTRGWRTLYRWVAGSGYHPLRAGWWLLASAMLAALLVWGFGPTQITTATGQAPSFDPFLYGFATVMPPAAAIVPSSWAVTEPGWLAWTLIALKAFGWILTAILLAGLAGVLKKE